jgi:hypothetical protein
MNLKISIESKSLLRAQDALRMQRSESSEVPDAE